MRNYTCVSSLLMQLGKLSLVHLLTEYERQHSHNHHDDDNLRIVEPIGQDIEPFIRCDSGQKTVCPMRKHKDSRLQVSRTETYVVDVMKLYYGIITGKVWLNMDR